MPESAQRHPAPPSAYVAPPPEAFSLESHPELTLRAVLVALVVAAVIGASYPLIVLKLGFGPNISVVSAFFGYMALSAIGFFTGTRAGRLENNLVQTAGTTAGQSGFMCVVLAAFDMLNAKPGLGFSVHLSPLQTFLWLSIAGLLGVLAAVPLRRHFIEEEELAFPDGVAAGQTLLILDDPKQAKRRTRMLGFGLLASGALTWLQTGLPKAIRFVPEHLYFGTGGSLLKMGMGWSLLSFGSGLLVGLRVMVSMGIGMIVAWLILPGVLLAHGAVASATMGEVIRWVMWPATGMLVAGGLTSLALKWRVIARTFTALDMKSLADGEEFPIRWVLIGTSILAVALCVLQYVSLGLPVWITAVAILLSLPLMLVGTRVLGETNWAPVSAMANLMQGVFAVLAPGHLPTNMIASGMSGSIAANGEHLMQDYKAGKIVGSSPRLLTYLQLIAVPVGAAAVSLVYPILRERYGVVDRTLADGSVKVAELSSPISVKWAGFAELLSQGLDVLPKGSGWALLVGCLIGAAIAVGEGRPGLKRFLPSPTGIGIGMLIPGIYVLPMLLGGITQAVWKRVSHRSEEEYSTALASGFIAGEALVSVILALIAAAALTFGLGGS